MDGSSASWVTDLIVGFRAGRLSAEELWCVVLDCHGLHDPAPVVRLVLRSHAALNAAPSDTAPSPSALPAAHAHVEATNEAELFVLDEAVDDLSIPA